MAARTRLTLTFGALLVVAGVALTAMIYLLVRADLNPQLQRAVRAVPYESVTPSPTDARPVPIPEQGVRIAAAETIASNSESTVLNKLLLTSGISLLVMTAVCLFVVWWLSGRVLAPVKKISAHASRLSTESLHERIRLTGPKDELTELAGTFDNMLERLEKAFESQRQFIANASHELRTPISIQRTAIQVGLNDPTPSSVADTKEKLLAANRRIERLLDSLLTLAHSDRGLEHRESVDVADCVKDQLDLRSPDIAERELHTRTELAPYVVNGDTALITRLVDNLLTNAIRYNVNGGWIEIRTSTDGLAVSNTGQEVTPDLMDRIFHPFQRGENRTSSGGAGLGLSIVESIVEAHGGTVTAVPRIGGGLEVTVSLPESDAPPTETDQAKENATDARADRRG